MVGSFGLPELVIVLAIALSSFFVIWPASRICRRIGYPWWLGIFSVVPIANIGLLWFVGFTEWPLERAPIKAPPA
jgi:hypothetical protein